MAVQRGRDERDHHGDFTVVGAVGICIVARLISYTSFNGTPNSAGESQKMLLSVLCFPLLEDVARLRHLR